MTDLSFFHPVHFNPFDQICHVFDFIIFCKLPEFITHVNDNAQTNERFGKDANDQALKLALD